MRQGTRPDRTNFIVGLVAVALAVVVGFSVVDNPEIMSRLTPGIQTPKSVSPKGEAAGRGQPIIIPAGRPLRAEEREALEWIMAPPLPPIPSSGVVAVPPPVPEQGSAAAAFEAEALTGGPAAKPPAEGVPEETGGGGRSTVGTP